MTTKMTTKITITVTQATKMAALAHSIKLSSDVVPQVKHTKRIHVKLNVTQGGDYSACDSKQREITKADGD
jgi:hypothetical protein